jgi:hypothetical protein
MHLQIEDEDLAAFRAILGSGEPFTWPKLIATAAPTTDGGAAWALLVVPDAPAPLGDVPLLALISETGTPHVPEAVTALVNEFNARPADGWLRILADVAGR